MATAKDVLRQAEIYAQNGQTDKAKKFYQAIIDRMPDSAEAKQARAGLQQLAAPKKKKADFDDLDDLFESEEMISEKSKLQPKKPAQSVRRPQNVNQNMTQHRVLQNDLPAQPAKPPLAVWKLVSGILSIVLTLFVLFQSCAAGLGNALENNGEVGGSAGVLLAILMLAAGIVAIATRKSTKNGGNIAIIVMDGIAALFGFVGAGSYGDLNIWAGWCLICLVLAIVAMIKNRKNRV